MRAAVLHAVGKPLAIESIAVADPAPFEVRVRVAAAGLCHSDLRFMDGDYPPDVPAVFGHESAGVVDEVGSAVTHVVPGDHVITCLSVFCGHCEYCLVGRSNLCERREATMRGPGETARLTLDGAPLHQFLQLGSFAEQMLVHENAVVKVADEIPLDRAALLGCGAAAGLGAVLNTAGVRPGETVAVVGCGGVGLAAVQGARIAGAARIVAVDRVAAKLDLAKRLGATDGVDASATDPVEAVRELTGGGVHHAFEAIGRTDTVEQAFAMLRRRGTATVLGLIPAGRHIRVPGEELFYERRLQGSAMGSNRFRVDLPRYVAMYLDGRLLLDEMVSERITLEEVNDGFARMRTGEGVRSVIVFD